MQIEAVLWEHGNAQELPPFPGDGIGTAAAINDKGQVVGASGCIASNTIRAVLWPNGPNGGVIDLGNLGGTAFDLAFDINNRGQVVGQSNLVGETIHHAFLWQDGVITDLGYLPGHPLSVANSINDQDQIVGFSQTENDPIDLTAVAVLWQDSVIVNLNKLVPHDSVLFLAEALSINNRGEIAGYGHLSNGEHRAFLLSPCDDRNLDVKGCEENDRREGVNWKNTRWAISNGRPYRDRQLTADGRAGWL